jgi:anti-sigma regulatory factor (Ser/Thr protein kinase)
VQFLSELRQCYSAIAGRFFADFTTIESISPAGALLLVAECDRWRETIAKQKLEPLNVNQWHPEVRNRLLEMGFFRLMRSTKPVVRQDIQGADESEQYLPFESGHKAEGIKAQALRLEIEKLGPKLRDHESLFEGLTEAMTNVEHHAYPVSAKVRRWWMSASVNATGRRLTVMFVDHGVGIPRTLPPDVVEHVRSALAQGGFEKLVKSDAKLIKAAVSLARSQTLKPHRGNGLKRDIQGYIERHDAVGSLLIISGRGQYRYTKQSGLKGKATTKALPIAFNGTFIEWVIEEYAASESHD